MAPDIREFPTAIGKALKELKKNLDDGVIKDCIVVYHTEEEIGCMPLTDSDWFILRGMMYDVCLSTAFKEQIDDYLE